MSTLCQHVFNKINSLITSNNTIHEDTKDSCIVHIYSSPAENQLAFYPDIIWKQSVLTKYKILSCA